MDNKLRAIDEKIQRYLDDMDAQDREENLERLINNRAYYQDIMHQLHESDANLISTVDPDSVVMENKKGGLEPGYNVQSVVDERYKIVVEIETTSPSVEHPFGTVKRSLGFGYYLLRTLPKVSSETSLIFLGYDIKHVFNVLGFKNSWKNWPRYKANGPFFH